MIYIYICIHCIHIYIYIHVYIYIYIYIYILYIRHIPLLDIYIYICPTLGNWWMSPATHHKTTNFDGWNPTHLLWWYQYYIFSVPGAEISHSTNLPADGRPPPVVWHHNAGMFIGPHMGFQWFWSIVTSTCTELEYKKKHTPVQCVFPNFI